MRSPARQQIFQARAAVGNAAARSAGQPHFGAAAGHAHHVLNRERIRSQNHHVCHADYCTVNVYFASQFWPPMASFTATAMVYSPGRMVGVRLMPMDAGT